MLVKIEKRLFCIGIFLPWQKIWIARVHFAKFARTRTLLLKTKRGLINHHQSAECGEYIKAYERRLFLPLAMGNWQMISVLIVSWERYTGAYFNIKERHHKLSWQWDYKIFLEDLVCLCLMTRNFVSKQQKYIFPRK